MRILFQKLVKVRFLLNAPEVQVEAGSIGAGAYAVKEINELILNTVWVGIFVVDDMMQDVVAVGVEELNILVELTKVWVEWLGREMESTTFAGGQVRI